MNLAPTASAIAAVAVLSLTPLAASAAATVTYVSVDGVVTNPCTIAAPCPLQKAVNSTKTGGRVIILDSGTYTSVNIARSISIVVPDGNHAMLVPAAVGANGVTINAPGADVVLKGLAILNGNGKGANGISVLAASTVSIEDCRIEDFDTAAAPDGNGIVATGNVKLTVSNTISRGNGLRGIALRDGVTATIVGSQLRDTTDQASGAGLALEASGAGMTTTAYVSDSLIENNLYGAFGSQTSAGTLLLFVDRSRAVANYIGVGGFTLGGGAVVNVAVTNSLISGNNHGLYAQGPGTSLIFGGNAVSDNDNGAVNLLNSASLVTHGNNMFEHNITAISGTVTSNALQ